MQQYSPRILLIDPEENIIDFLCLGLRYEGYQVVSCQRGLEGVETARQIHFDLVILELVLPDSDGLEICRMLRADQTTYELPILVLSRAQAVKTHLHALEAGASA